MFYISRSYCTSTDLNLFIERFFGQSPLKSKGAMHRMPELEEPCQKNKQVCLKMT